MFWGIGATVPSVHPAPDNVNGGHDHSGLGVFPPIPDFAGPSFRIVDVFSLSTRYADADITPGDGISIRENALDYDLAFLGADGSVVAGVPMLDFVDGWTLNSLADNFVARWTSPIPAVGGIHQRPPFQGRCGCGAGRPARRQVENRSRSRKNSSRSRSARPGARKPVVRQNPVRQASG
jgi:hypothetical protein